MFIFTYQLITIIWIRKRNKTQYFLFKHTLTCALSITCSSINPTYMKSAHSKILGLIAMSSMIASATLTDNPYGLKESSPGRELELLSHEEIARRKRQFDIENAKARGLKIFEYDGGHTIAALNQKTADKKARKNGWL